MSLASGTRLGPYEIQSAIGAGGMGQVYRALDTRLDRSVAIKILPPELSADPDRRTRLEREAKTIAGLNHSRDTERRLLRAPIALEPGGARDSCAVEGFEMNVGISSSGADISRRDFLGVTLAGFGALAIAPAEIRAVVSVVKIKNDNVQAAVEKAIDLIGGIGSVTKGKNRMMLKPNLVAPVPGATTNREVIAALARLMKAAHKDVSIGEGSAAAEGFNAKGAVVFRTRNVDLLTRLQAHVFEQTGYAELGKSLRVPLVNLHCGEMARVTVPGGFVYTEVTLHRSLAETDLLCSVPIMKTHGLAHVTLGMKNLVGVFPGTEYCAVRACMHDAASTVEPSGTAAAVVDMVRANKLGLVVVDASTAMEGQGPSQGTPVKMGLIIAGTNPLATDMVSASLMGFQPEEIPTFRWANKAGMKPAGLGEIEVRGERLENVRRTFTRATVYPWAGIRNVWGVQEIRRP